MAPPDPGRWFLSPQEVGRAPAYTGGNAAEFLIDGQAYMAHLAARLGPLRAGDELHLAGWRTTPALSLQPGLPGAPSLARRLSDLSARGVRVRALLWRFPVPLADRIVPRLRDNPDLARVVRAGGGEAVLDGRLPRGVFASHHQKAVVLRSGDEVRAYAGGIDLCRGRWDTPRHAGRPARLPGDFAAWHDVGCTVRGEAAAQVWENFTERWNDPTPPAPSVPPPPPIGTARPRPRSQGRQHVQVLRTLAPGIYPFAPGGERGVRLLYERAARRARHYLYIEDQFLWPSSLTGCLRDAAARGVHVILVTSPTYGVPGLGPFHNALQQGTLRRVRSGSPEHVHVFGLRQASGHAPIHVHSKVLIADDELAVIGSANLNWRSQTTDTELALAVVDGDTVPGRMAGRPAEVARFARDLRLALWGEHLGLDAAALDDPLRALAAWPSPGGPGQVHHAVPYHPASPRLHVPRVVPALMNPDLGRRS